MLKMKMIHEILLVIFSQVSVLLASPLRFPLLQPMQGTLQQQQLALQEQMLAIQQFQALQRFNAVPSPSAMNIQQPLLLLLPNAPPNEQDDRYNRLNENIVKNNKPSQAIEDEDSDSITVDAEPLNNEIDKIDAKNTQIRAILLVPNNARLSLGSIIEGIPFLPFEVNVPDSISWAWNGISGIISGIGQSWPFNRPQTGEDQNGMSVKSIWKDLKTRNLIPIIVMPLGPPMLPFQV